MIYDTFGLMDLGFDNAIKELDSKIVVQPIYSLLTSQVIFLRHGLSHNTPPNSCMQVSSFLLASSNH